MICPKFVDHLVFRVAELGRTERFYTAFLGPPSQRAEGSLMYKAGDTRLFFTLSNRPRQGAYDKENVGLNHIAFGVRTLEELKTITTRQCWSFPQRNKDRSLWPQRVHLARRSRRHAHRILFSTCVNRPFYRVKTTTRRFSLEFQEIFCAEGGGRGR